MKDLNKNLKKIISHYDFNKNMIVKRKRADYMGKVQIIRGKIFHITEKYLK